MNRKEEEKDLIHARLTILDIVSRFRETEKVFKRYDEQAGVCLCCQALFEPLEIVAEKYGLDLEALLQDLRRAVQSNPFH